MQIILLYIGIAFYILYIKNNLYFAMSINLLLLSIICVLYKLYHTIYIIIIDRLNFDKLTNKEKKILRIAINNDNNILILNCKQFEFIDLISKDFIVLNECIDKLFTDDYESLEDLYYNQYCIINPKKIKFLIKKLKRKEK